MENIFEILETKEKDPLGGLYVHLFQPKKDISEPGKFIKKGTSVIKPGSFKTTLSGRMKSYFSPKYWHYPNTDKAAFKNEVIKSYLVFDATKLAESDRWLIIGLEEKLMYLIEKYFETSKIGKGRSEYREIKFISIIDFDDKIKLICTELKTIVSKNTNQ
tara:strand:+ start:7295 stop:7774 length:480 start_codon:yes stop_codon:yes gene_type:complete